MTEHDSRRPHQGASEHTHPRGAKVTQRFGGITAVDGVSLTVDAGTVHALIPD